MPKCISDLDFERYHAGELPEVRASEIESHLAACESCTKRRDAYLSAHERMLGRLRGLKGLEPPPPPAADNRASKVSKDWALDALPPRAAGLAIEGYQILRELHHGGQGVVFQAMQKATKRKVAIKVLLEGYTASVSSKKRFMREIDLVAQLKHPGIITIFDSGETADGRHYYVMDFVQGDPLNKHVQDRNLSLEDTLRLFVGVCKAIQYANDRGVVHRDLKPSNVLVDVDGTAKVLDFGLAKSLGSAPQTQVSLTGQVFGTLPYMSPEQAGGRPDEVDARTDVYALGVMLYEILTGRYPYDVTGAVAQAIRNIAEAEPTPPSRAWRAETGIKHRRVRKMRSSSCPIDHEVETIVLKCLAKEPFRRYQSAGALGEDIERYLAGQPIQAKRDSSWYIIKKSLPRYKVTMAVAAALVIAALCGWIVWNERAAAAAQKLAEQTKERETTLEKCRDAIMLMDTKRLSELLDRAQGLGIDPSVYHTYRGFVLLLKIEVEAAMKEAEQAIALAPRNSEAYYLRAGLHALRQNFLAAGQDFATGLKHSKGTSLELAFQALLKSLLGQFDAAISDLDGLVARQHGSVAILFVRGFCRWMRVLQSPPLEMQMRLKMAQDALGDLNAAAAIYSNIPFMFDMRADLLNRLTAMTNVTGDQKQSDEYLRLMEEDGKKLIRLGAVGTGHDVFSRCYLFMGDAKKAFEEAQRAYKELSSPQQVASLNHQDSLRSSISSVLISGFAIGDDAALLAAAQLLAKENPTHAKDFDFGMVRGFAEDTALLRRVGLDAKSPNSLVGYHVLGVWAGMAARGESELAATFAGWFNVGLLERMTFTGTMTRYIQGKESEKAMIAAAGDDVGNLQMAYFMAAMGGKSRASRLQKLEEVLKLGHPGWMSSWAKAMVIRAERDPDFLGRPILRKGGANAGPTTRPDGPERPQLEGGDDPAKFG